VRPGRVNAVGVLVLVLWTAAVLVPLGLAWSQLAAVAEAGIIETLADFEGRFQSQGSLQFTFVIAFLSTVITLLLGVPLAWNLGRHRWPAHSLLRGLFTAPFVMPSILAAMGFLTLISVFESISGFDLRSNDEMQLAALLLAHAWFNLALVVRFCEPVLATVDPSLEEAARLLPRGRTRSDRLLRLWAPLLTPSLLAAAAMTFVFSFTSFALVRHLTPGRRNLEIVMANQADWAGIRIPELGRAASEIVMAASLVQLLTMVTALGLISWLQSRARRDISASVVDARTTAPVRSWKSVHLMMMAAFVLAPLLGVLVASLQVRQPAGLVWSFDGWRAAVGSQSATDLTSALGWSVAYAILTLVIALPLGFLLAENIHRAERMGHGRFAIAIDVLAMLPLALSAVMIGLGVLIGLLRTDVTMLRSWWIPAYGHVMITTPFVVRVLLPAIRAIDPDLDGAAALLGASPLRRLLSIRLPLLTPSLIVASALVVAISLGEFGASWVVVRFTEWSTLPVMVDELLSRPGFDPLLRPAANAAGVVLLLLTLVLFMMVERFRPLGRGGDF